MLRFRCVEIRVQCYDSSRGQEERANLESFAAILHLQDHHLNLSAFITSSGAIEE